MNSSEILALYDKEQRIEIEMRKRGGTTAELQAIARVLNLTLDDVVYPPPQE